ncbi:MAG: Crp/Fnr family transcriptional regulator [Pseudomonadota bacterium]
MPHAGGPDPDPRTRFRPIVTMDQPGVSVKTAVDLIRDMPLFSGLDEDDFTQIIAVAERREVHKGDMIFTEGDPCTGFYMVETGKVKIFKVSFGGKEQILHIYGPGRPFGEVPVFTGKNFPASAQAVSGSTLIFFPRKDFVNLITGNPSLALNMLGVMSMRLREFTVMVENLALKEVPGRLASYLQVLEKEQKRKGRVTLPVSKNQLSGLLGTTPETVSRILTRMGKDGLIRMNNKEIVILDPDGIRDLSEGVTTI